MHHNIKIAALLVLLTASWTCMAQSYPSRPIRVIIPLSAGSLTDTVLRMLAPKMSEALGTSVVIENMPGAAAIIGTVAAAKAPADGYTVGVAAASSFSVNPHLHKQLGYDPIRDFAPVCRLGDSPYVLVVNPALGIKSVAELVAKAKTQSLSFGSSGQGTAQHLAQEMFKARVGAPFMHVPYKGTAQAVIDTVGGHTHVLMDTPGPLIPHVKSGKLVALAVTSERRLRSLPDVPTFEELGLTGLRLGGWIGLVVPVGTPAPVINQLVQACQSATSSPEIANEAQIRGFELSYAPPAEFRLLIVNDLARWGQLVQLSGVKPE